MIDRLTENWKTQLKVNNHIYIKTQWLSECIKFLVTGFTTSTTTTTTTLQYKYKCFEKLKNTSTTTTTTTLTDSEKETILEEIYQQVLLYDISESCIPSLPTTTPPLSDPSTKTQILKGTYFVQISETINISEPFETRLDDDNSQFRTLKFIITDGYQTLIAIEYKYISFLNPHLPPGTKAFIKDVPIRRGILLLDSNNIRLLGGNVDRLIQEKLNKLKKGAIPSKIITNNDDDKRNNNNNNENNHNNHNTTTIGKKPQLTPLRTTMPTAPSTTNKTSPPPTSKLKLSTNPPQSAPKLPQLKLSTPLTTTITTTTKNSSSTATTKPTSTTSDIDDYQSHFDYNNDNIDIDHDDNIRNNVSNNINSNNKSNINNSLKLSLSSLNNKNSTTSMTSTTILNKKEVEEDIVMGEYDHDIQSLQQQQQQQQQKSKETIQYIYSSDLISRIGIIPVGTQFKLNSLVFITKVRLNNSQYCCKLQLDDCSLHTINADFDQNLAIKLIGPIKEFKKLKKEDREGLQLKLNSLMTGWEGLITLRFDGPDGVSDIDNANFTITDFNQDPSNDRHYIDYLLPDDLK
eukprot:gene5165-6430_t